MSVSTRSYHYRMLYPASIAIMLTLIPVLICVVIVLGLGGEVSSREAPYVLVATLPIIVMMIAPPIWGISIFRTRIIMSDAGLEIQGITKRVKADWKNIRKIEKVAIFSGTFPTFGPPQDLQITLNNKKKINIYWFLEGDSAGSGGIGELEQQIARKFAQMSADTA